MATTLHEGDVVEHSGTLRVILCHKCAIPFGMPSQFQARRREDGGTFYCPNGHGAVYRTSTSDQLRAELDQVKADRDYWQRQRREEIERLQSEKRRHAATKGQLTKTRKRADAGVCQHCNRSFANVARHVAHMHPWANS